MAIQEQIFMGKLWESRVNVLLKKVFPNEWIYELPLAWFAHNFIITRNNTF